MMHLLFLGSFFEKSKVDRIWQNSKGAMTVSADTFQQALLDGWEKLGVGCGISLVTLPSVGSFPLRYKKPWVQGHRFEYGGKRCVSGGFLNFPQVKQTSIYYSARRYLMRWAAQTPGSRTIIVYALFASYIRAAVEVKKRYPETRICTIVLDLPEYFDDRTSLLRRMLKKREQRALARLLPAVDSYVLLTEQMSGALGVGHRPYIIIEGIFSPDNSTVAGDPGKDPHKTILYTGKLDNRFGIGDLLGAFGCIEGDDYRLWICGDGSARADVEKAAVQDPRIVYFGNVKREEALRMQRQATLLVNPRRGDEEYTKYSFPSKTMEYMASGTPTVMYPLPGMPEEYRSHVAIIPDATRQALAATLEAWCGKPAAELQTFGQRARDFILENKNSVIQAKRLYDFVCQQDNA